MKTVIIYAPGIDRTKWYEAFRKDNLTDEQMHKVIDEAFRLYGEGTILKIY